MTRLSVNLNKVALLRNQRDVGYPDILEHGKLILEAGAHGLTVHPRPDQRHIRRSDIPALADFVAAWPDNRIELNIEGFKKWRPDLADAEFVLEGGKYICGWEIEKMSKSKYNVVNPDDIIERYGADTLRLYEMFLGPLEQFKPWNTNGIDGVKKFLGKLWRLFHNGNGEFDVSDAQPSKEELKALHKTIKKAGDDIDRYSFNTSVSTFMICVNELSALKSNNRAILEDLLVVISPYAPHITEELWSLLGHKISIIDASYPTYSEQYLKEDNIQYPVMVNGKMRAKIEVSADLNKEEVEQAALAHETVQKWLEGKTPKKVIVVPKKIVNLVV